MDGDALRSAFGLCAAAPAERASHVPLQARNVWALQEAREILERLVGQAGDWAPARRAILMEYLVEPSMRATVMASSLAATLELVREGRAGSAPAVGVRADLSAQARRGGAGGGQFERGDAARDGIE